MPFRPGTELSLFADGTGSSDSSRKPLLTIYALELVWRIAMKSELPTDIGDWLKEIATKTGKRRWLAWRE
jgi:hypothetical protein